MCQNGVNIIMLKLIIISINRALQDYVFVF